MSPPRRCTVCRQRPVAISDAGFCFTCWPGGPVVPPPCLRCGSRTDYFTNGVCARCHAHARPGVDSCVDCLAWGATRHRGWRCIACQAWAARLPVAACGACRRVVPVDGRGYCRLCRRQRTHSVTRHVWGAVEDATRHGQQLFLANLSTRKGSQTPYIPARPPIDIKAMTPVAHRQLTLLDLPRDMANGRRRGFVEPTDQALFGWLRQCVHEHARRHGWTPGHRETIQRGVKILLTLQDTPGAPIKGSELAWAAQLGISAPALSDVLINIGWLEEDRPAPITIYFAEQTADLPTAFQHDLQIWFDVMRHGSTTPPRRRPRADATTGNNLRAALPALRDWAQRYDTLREVTRADVLATLPASGPQRTLMLQGLRSIFRILKPRGLIFANPTYRIHQPAPDWPAPAAVDLQQLRSALDSPNPACAVLAALLAFHGVRVKHLREMLITDIHDGRLQHSDQSVLLAEPVRRRIAAWLSHRNTRWPNTANQHLFLNYRNATNTREVSTAWINGQLGMTAQSIRQDRILDEALATHGDLRQVSDLFGLTAAGAYRYTSVLDKAAEALERAEKT